MHWFLYSSFLLWVLKALSQLASFTHSHTFILLRIRNTYKFTQIVLSDLTKIQHTTLRKHLQPAEQKKFPAITRDLKVDGDEPENEKALSSVSTVSSLRPLTIKFSFHLFGCIHICMRVLKHTLSELQGMWTQTVRIMWRSLNFKRRNNF